MPIMTKVYDFPWSPVAEALRSVGGCLAIVIAMSLLGGVVGHWTAHICLPSGIWPRGFLAQVPLLWIFTPEVLFAVFVSFAVWHRSVFFPSARAYLALVALPFVVWSLGACSSVARLGAWPIVPPEFAGEWVREDAKFDRELLAEGAAIFLGKDGFVAVSSAPPPVGRSGRAVFDPQLDQFTFTLGGNGHSPEVMTAKIVVDREKLRTFMESSNGVKGRYTRGRDKAPKWAQELAK
jgi:hypothetical protein